MIHFGAETLKAQCTIHHVPFSPASVREEAQRWSLPPCGFLTEGNTAQITPGDGRGA